MLRLVCVCIVCCSWLFWLDCQYLRSDWLYKTPPRKPYRDKEIISTKLRTNGADDFSVFVYSLNVLLCFCLYTIFFILIWHNIAGLC